VNKRTFLKFFSAMMAWPAISPRLAWASGKLKNWAGNLEFLQGAATLGKAVYHVSVATEIEL
jgi:hypothetical protein